MASWDYGGSDWVIKGVVMVSEDYGGSEGIIKVVVAVRTIGVVMVL